VVKITGSSYVPPPITEEEIKGVIDQGLAEKAIEKDEMELVHGALKFDDTVIRSVMTCNSFCYDSKNKDVYS
jgi:CBS domain containing-hemolysin-like protein